MSAPHVCPELREQIAETYGEDILFADGHDNAILGVVARCGDTPFIIYDYETVIDNLVKGGMDEEEAIEWVAYNWQDAWYGEKTPAILERVSCVGE